MTQKQSSAPLSSTLSVAIGSALLACITTHIYHHHRHRHRHRRHDRHDHDLDPNDNPDSSSQTSLPPPQQLGPEITPETKYQLALRGTVDEIYQQQLGPKPFEFNQEVCNVFDDMVSRSVPLYCEVIDLAIYWFQKYYKVGTKLYDLGCSTGTTIDVLARSLDGRKDGGRRQEQEHRPIVGQFVGIDNSSAMVDACQKKLEWAHGKHDIQISCGDILDVKITNASFVIMNYTLQFIPVVHRPRLLRLINEGTCNGGVLLISEKVRAECSELQETCTSIYEDFKHRRKYTKREIARKKEALMNVLIPFTEGELKLALISAGFETVEIIAKWNNFTTFVARKKAPVATRKVDDNHSTSISQPTLAHDTTPIVTSEVDENHSTSTSQPTFALDTTSKVTSELDENHLTASISQPTCALDTTSIPNTTNLHKAFGGVSKFVEEVVKDVPKLKWQVVGYGQSPDGSLDYSRPYHNMSNPNDFISKILGLYTAETRNHLQVLSCMMEERMVNESTLIEKQPSKRQQKKKKQSKSSKVTTTNLDRLLDASPAYLSDLVDPELLESFLLQRTHYFAEKGGLSIDTNTSYDEIAKMILDLPKMKTKNLIVNDASLVIGDADELSSEQMELFQDCIQKLKPWKKGPLNLFGTQIDTEWRSDLKWERLQKSLPDLTGKVICDLGCGNGYFMFRMLEYNPKMVIGIDPNLHAFLEFNLFQRMSGVENVKFEYLRGDCMTSFPNTFDVVYCLGVLYHTNDPIGMLKDIYQSMKGNAVSSMDIFMFVM